MEQKPDLYSTAGSIGMKVVSEPADAAIDIVFVHGLTGNRESTWTHKNGVFWPELLANDIQGARIMTFGYDADVIKIWGIAGSNNLRNHGKSLAFAVSDRRRPCRERPIIFIAHSLGGLVCEQALLYCREGERNLEKVFQSTRGIIFMGTPHAGADLAKWGFKLAQYLDVGRRTNSAILDPLRQKSDVLTAVQQQFQQLLRKRGIEIYIYCFFEEKAVIGVGLIVPEYSAVLSQYPNQGISANHMDMTRFIGENDGGYQRVLSRVLDNLELIESSNTILEKHPDHEKRTECHRLFRTSQYERHKDRNPDPVKGTCIWFLQHPNYVSWRNSRNSSLLWVSADPGCGKSVLSKYLVDDKLRASRSRTTCYFFFKDDNEDQKSATNALCAILHQLFDQKPELLGYGTENYDRNGKYLKDNITLMWNLLVTASTDPKAGEIICIIDALDKCRQSQLSILLPKICSFYNTHPSTTALKSLLTSRPLERIEYEFHELSQIIPEIRLAGEEDTDQIRSEIDLVIGNEIGKLQQKWPNNQEAIDALRDEFAKVENRTYLWLTLIFDLIRQDLQSLTKSGRQKIFGTLPRSVDDAYIAILNEIKDKDQARKLLQVVCAAARPLSVQETFVAISIREEDISTKDLGILSDDVLKTLIRNSCGLFVRVIDGRVYLLHQTAKEFLMAPQDDLQTILNPVSDSIWKHSFSVSDSHFVLTQSCMWYLRLENLYVRGPLPYDAVQLVSEYNFLKYSAKNWALHFRSALIPEAHSLIALGLELCSPSVDQCRSWVPVYWLGHVFHPFLFGLPSLSFASELGLLEVVRQRLSAPSVDINQVDGNGGTPLWWAASTGHEAVVRQLLATPGIDVNAVGKKGQMPLLYAISTGHEAIVSQLLVIPGINVNATDENGWTPLSYAACQGYEDAVRKLLATPKIDVNVNSKDGNTPLLLTASRGHDIVIRQLLAAPGIKINVANNDGETPLWWAASKGHESIVRQLLAVPGIDINIVNRLGEAPLNVTTSKGHEAVVQLLTAFGINVICRP